MSKSKYQEWIDVNVMVTYGQCKKITLQMQQAFPALELVRGYYYCTAWGERHHWWLKTKDDDIVDPTAAQFPSKGHGVYIEHTDDMPVPTGKCLNCGDLIYGERDPFCSEHCERETVAYTNFG